MKSTLLVFLLVLCGAASAQAQTEFFVDPASGSDGSAGTQGAPFKTLTFALTQTSAGDSVTLRAGTYSAVNETFPILLLNGVDVDIFQSETPVFDGGGSGTLFRLSENVSTVTTLRGVDITDCNVGVEIPAGTAVDGFVIQQCNFSGFADSAPGANDGYGVLAMLSSGGLTEDFTVDQCTFAGNTARDAISIQLSNATIMNAGGVLANTSSGGVDRTLYLLADEASTVAGTYNVHDNVFAGYSEAGIYFHAKGGGGNPLLVSTINCQANGNFLTGAGGTENGFQLRAEHNVVGQGGVVSPWICYSRVTGNQVNVLCETINGSGHTADILADFYGNRLENATRAGVELTTLVPTAGNDNNDPDFGPGHTGRASCLNTFTGNVQDFRIGAGVINTINARFNFFADGPPTATGGVPDTAGTLTNTINGSFASSVPPNAAAQVQLNAAADSAFVDYDGSATTGQIEVVVDGTQLDQADITEMALGAGLLLQLPALTAGNKTVTVTNHGGQTGTFTLNVTASGSGGGASEGGNDCFVATAAHGDYGSHEVVALRRFRDQYLKSNSVGQSFVDWYYDNGPTGAAFLLEHEWARKSARVALAGPAAVADAITSWNPGQRFAAAILLLGFMFRLVWRPRNA
ncbi:MAG: DUF1565 domain-containing protein [Planctomycetes bacterium]|nr:DUF1565 domain-containing protein [Planctomycetota bacterium]MCP4771081.1 DUF1565 domain-containing protein [Planctomycetota bacterium]MCP4861639.1 DUF1565 domain-containing protein [Planctomycetota bacterium]